MIERAIRCTTRMTRCTVRWWLAGLAMMSLATVGVVGTSAVLAPSEAHAVIGRPLTPGSYAGVARRTSRRTVRRTAYYGGYGAPAPNYVTALPPGCAMAGGVYGCGGGVAYQPMYDGPNVVYVPVG